MSIDFRRRDARYWPEVASVGPMEWAGLDQGERAVACCQPLRPFGRTITSLNGLPPAAVIRWLNRWLRILNVPQGLTYTARQGAGAAGVMGSEKQR